MLKQITRKPQTRQTEELNLSSPSIAQLKQEVFRQQKNFKQNLPVIVSRDSNISDLGSSQGKVVKSIRKRQDSNHDVKLGD
jgi:hypothetical protein